MRRMCLLTSRIAVTATALILGTAWLPAGDLQIRRGDTNGDGIVDLSDGIATLLHLFLGTFDPQCLDAADVDDSGGVELTDGIFTFNFLFAGGDRPPPPGPLVCGPDPTEDPLGCVSSPCPPVDTSLQRIGHILNRLAYGPTADDIARIEEIGIRAYMEQQLEPEAIDESDNDALNSRVEDLFEERPPSRDVRIIARGEVWRYFKGTEEPSPGAGGRPTTDWTQAGFDDSSWLLGPTGIGYGDGDDATVLGDMRQRADDPDTPDVDESRPGYASVYMRTTFDVADPAAMDGLVLRIDYDDGFVAYLNGRQVARTGNVPAGLPAHDDTTGDGHEAGDAEEFTIPVARLQAGPNVFAIHGLNTSLTSSDFSNIPELISREILPGPAIRTIRGTEALQQLVHIRGIYSRRQLQAVLAEFWENHFTTDNDKLLEYFDDLANSDATDAMSTNQARRESAQIDFEEYEFYYDNALGNFGDLLLYSATSVSMLVYLDNVLNIAGEANENYAREILELSAFGVDNRYVQRDIEELAEIFTGWNICKVAREELPGFPDSALNPPNVCGVQFTDSVFLNLGPGWKYFKGTREPTPGPGGVATDDWAEPDFDDSSWLNGSTGIGYGDGDDATVLGDMRGNYMTVYLRREFTVNNPREDFDNLLFEVAYDDGYVAYLNGIEISRSDNMEDEGVPPPFDVDADEGHEVDEGIELINLNGFIRLLRPAPATNVLAIQVHNTNLGSSDLSMLPRLINRRILPGSIENGDPTAVFTFRFNPDQHDRSNKVLFRGTPLEINVQGRAGPAGVNEALDVINDMVGHPSTSEFICIKLIQKFVSDQITLVTFHDQSAPQELRGLLADAIAAWNSTTPPGNIETVLRAILDPENRASLFWEPIAYRTKVRTPIEFINSTLRLLEASASGADLPDRNDAMGMFLFTRDEPDGWSELGFDWIDTATMRERIEFVQSLAENQADGSYSWDTNGFLQRHGLSTAEEIVDFFGDVMYHGTLSSANRDLLLEFLETNTNGAPLPLTPGRSDYQRRVQEFLGLMLSMPQWHFQ
ncbi:MAG: DUF1800 family protein [Planctomycetota bacterium]|nr:DUF1800 family protein [Planctomycetota bacterium]